VRLLITDLDNTLYDWVTFFASAFAAMTKELSRLIEVPEERLLDEFKSIHQYYGNSEQPFAVLELPSVRKRFPDASIEELRVALEPALQVFSAERRRHLHLYPGVGDALAALQKRGVRIVAHTEASTLNAYYRVKYLNIERYIAHLYALGGKVNAHPNPTRAVELLPPPGFLIIVPFEDRKPNPRLLLDICRSEEVSATDAWYVGDSLTRDMSMAKAAGLNSVWARYGTHYDRALWNTLVRVTHWTEADVRREEELRHKFSHVEPDYVIDSFSEVLDLSGIADGDVGGNGH
jgi:FMN phosphatase YigB (HAD superfamily)